RLLARYPAPRGGSGRCLLHFDGHPGAGGKVSLPADLPALVLLELAEEGVERFQAGVALSRKRNPFQGPVPPGPAELPAKPRPRGVDQEHVADEVRIARPAGPDP